MTAILTELIISWLLLKYIVSQNFSALGFYPFSKRQSILLLTGFSLPLIYLTVLYTVISVWVQNPYKLNPDYTLTRFANSTGYVLKGVVFEELLFRGALLYILVRKINPNLTIAISAVSFGVYHWFSYSVLGQPVNMLFVLIRTGIMGYLLALAFIKSQSILLPLGLHSGYNFTSMILFSNETNTGLQLLIKTYAVDPVKPEGLLPLLLIIIYYTGFPLLCFFLIRILKSPPSTKQ